MLLTPFKESAGDIKYVDNKWLSVVIGLCTPWLFAENLHMCQACYKLANVTSQTTVFYTSYPKGICPFAMKVPSQVSSEENRPP